MRHPTDSSTVVIFGLDRLGAALAGAWKRAWPNDCVRGVDESAARREAALTLGALEFATDAPEAACAGADYLVLNRSVSWIVGRLPQLAALAPETSLLTDTASTKVAVERAAVQYLGPGWEHRWLGGHPLLPPAFGSDDAADADIEVFQTCIWWLVPPTGSASNLSPQQRSFRDRITALGCGIAHSDAAVFDQTLAWLNQAPQLWALAWAAEMQGRLPRGDASAPLLATLPAGLRSLLRQSARPYAEWRDTLHSNAGELDAALLRMQEALEQLRHGLRSREISSLLDAAAGLAARIEPRG